MARKDVMTKRIIEIEEELELFKEDLKTVPAEQLDVLPDRVKQVILDHERKLTDQIDRIKETLVFSQ